MFSIFKEPFFITSLICGMLVSSVCAYLGIYIYLKRIIFISISLTEIAALGVLLGIMAGVNTSISSFTLVFLGILFLSGPLQEKKVFKESVIGIIYVFCLSISIILLAKNPVVEASGIDIVNGNLLYANWNDIFQIGVIYTIVILLHMTFFRYFIFISFDKDTAQVSGINTKFYDVLLYLTIGLVISISTKVTGFIFTFSSLIIPLASSLLVGKNLKSIVFVAIIISITSILPGIILSYFLDLPTSPTIVVIYTLFFLFTSVFQKLFYNNKLNIQR